MKLASGARSCIPARYARFPGVRHKRGSTPCDGYKVDIVPAAEGDIREAFFWYRDRNVRAAQDFRLEVFSAIERIAQGPLIRAADETGTRKRILRRFPYTVMYW